MQRPITRGASAGAGLIFHVFAQDSTSTSGAGKASVAYSSWACRYIRNGEAISGAITPEDISTIGTYAAPTANTNIRIKAVDNTNMIGIYEVQIHADWVNTTNNCQSLTIYLTASGVAVLPIQIPLIGINQQAATQEVDVIKWLGTAAATPTVAGVPEVDVTHLGGGAQSATDLKDFADSGYDPSTNKVQGVVLVDTCTTNSDMRGTDSAATAAALSTVEGKVDTIDGIVDAVLADTAELQTDWVNGGRLDLLLDAIKAVTDAQGATGSGLTAVPWNAAWDAEVQSECADALAATDSIAAASISAAAANKIADHVLRRNSANVEASSDGDTLAFKSPYGGVAMNTHVKTPSGTDILVKKSDGTTTLATVSLTTDAGADPITGTGSA